MNLVSLRNQVALAAALSLPSTALAQSAVHLTNTSTSIDSYVRIPHSAALTPQQFTLETWIKPSGAGYGVTTDALGACLIGKSREAAVGTFLASWLLGYVPSSGKVYLHLTHIYGSQGATLFGSTVIPIGTSAHVAATFDGTEMKLYVNGVLDASATFPYTGVYYGTEDVLLGACNFGAGYYRRFDGTLDDVRIWDHARDQREIALERNCRLSGSEPGLLAYYTFNAPSAIDDSGHGHNGAIVGAASSYVAELVALPQCVSPTLIYCTGGTTTHGCVASMSSTGIASASQSSGFVLSATNVESDKSGLIFYGLSGPIATPWQGGSSFLCVKSPVQRTPAASSGGSSGSCIGAFSLDFLAFVAAHPGALGTPFSGGEIVNAQAWFRDPPAQGTTNLSNGICFLMAP
jgi:hypothetical protein